MTAQPETVLPRHHDLAIEITAPRWSRGTEALHAPPSRIQAMARC